MKRMLAVCLMTMLMLSLVLAVYGEETRGTTIEHVISDSFVINIPESVTIDDGVITVGINNKTSNDVVRIWVTSKSYTDYNAFLLTHVDNPNIQIGYQLSIDDYVITSNDNTLATLRGDGSVSLRVSLTDSGLHPAGRYTDRLTFHFG